MKFEQQGITPLNQLTNSLGHHSTDRNFPNFALAHSPLNGSEMSRLNMLFRIAFSKWLHNFVADWLGATITAS
jgi:hypothetical protein